MADKMARVAMSPLSLYRHLLRKVNALPNDAQSYYKHRIRQEYNNYSDEIDQERIEQIITQSLKDAEWIVKKYNQDKKQ